MLGLRYTAIILIFAELSAIGVKSSVLSPTECRNLGFSPEDLRCSNCQNLKQFQLNELEHTCRQCCTNNNDDEDKSITYHRAVLTLCKCKFGRYPQIAAFINSDWPQRFPRFSFQHVVGADPVLRLYDSKGEELQTLGIQNWDTNTLTTFLTEHLEI